VGPEALAAARAAAVAAGGIVRVINLGGNMSIATAVLPWPRLRAVAVDRVDTLEEARLLLNAHIRRTEP
jgi:hypothetical protein